MSTHKSSAGASNNAVQYSIVFVNNSTQTGSACIFQQNPGGGSPNVMSLAWFTKMTFPTTRVVFQWQVNYDFVWAQTGMLVPGVVFMASQVWPADLSTANQVTFTNIGGAYTFQNQTQGASPGNLYIREDPTIPANQAAVGIGMSGRATFAVQAQPNMNVIFTPRPQYWITFGNYVNGEVMDVQSISNPAQIIFPPNIYSMTATLNPDNTWTIAPTQTMNAQFVEGGGKDAKLTWGQKPGGATPSRKGAAKSKSTGGGKSKR